MRLDAGDVESRPWPTLAEALDYVRTLEGYGWQVVAHRADRPETHPVRGDGSRVLARVIRPGGGLVGEVTYWPAPG